MNFARLSDSARLQRLMAALSDGAWHGTRELVMSAEVMAINSAVAELRANGVAVESRCVGRGRWEYRRPDCAQMRLAA